MYFQRCGQNQTAHKQNMKNKVIQLMRALQIIDQLPVTENKESALNNLLEEGVSGLGISSGQSGYLYTYSYMYVKGCSERRYVRHITYNNLEEDFSLEIKVITDGGLPPSIIAYFYSPIDDVKSISIGC